MRRSTGDMGALRRARSRYGAWVNRYWWGFPIVVAFFWAILTFPLNYFFGVFSEDAAHRLIPSLRAALVGGVVLAVLMVGWTALGRRHRDEA